ncbi:MAG: cysteine--tRNA ligase [Rickettsiaceae bacterium]
MQLSVYNTKTKKKELFKSINKDLVTMYVCGPTVYDAAHIGNARSMIAFDILFRVLRLEFGSSNVRYVRNITDIDDKIINKALSTNTDIKDVVSNSTNIFHNDMKLLQCLTPTIEPRATDHIQDIIDIIQRLLDNDVAYIKNQHVYFNVRKDPNYTKLSNRSLEEMLDGVRIQNNKDKNSALDFVLWKPLDDNDPKDAGFESPWCIGRPGWHIECSAMSYKYLGKNFDIHGGGIDLIFPHHTNEISQNTCAFKDSSFANYWVHNGFVNNNGKKMSKSLGNIITVQDLVNHNIHPEAIRLCLLSTHYRKPLDFNDKALNDAKKMLNYWYSAFSDLEIRRDIDTLNSQNLDVDFHSALLDDLNISQAIKIINDYAKLIYTQNDLEKKKSYAYSMLACANFLGLMKNSSDQYFGYRNQDLDIQYIEQMIKKRNKAKLEKNWKKADSIREELRSCGISLEDKFDGSTIWKKLR